jgi:hypothetical protein
MVRCYNIDNRNQVTLSIYPNRYQKDHPLPKTNYQYEKRQKELDKKKKKAEKIRQKEERKNPKPEEKPAALPEK